MIVLMSMWRNDEHRKLRQRALHLLGKYAENHDVRYLWIVGDSSDHTEHILREYEKIHPNVEVVRYDSEIVGDDLLTCRRRGAWTATQMFQHIRDTDDFACFHESDLISPDNVLDRLLSNPLPVAGWPIIEINGKKQFYDIWAYRNLSGHHFTPEAQGFGLISVNSFGSVWMAPASMFRGRSLDETCVVGLCKQWRDEGSILNVDSTILIEQPVDLWNPV